MARIRTVKPELWTDPDFVELTPYARLLFIAALNFASDYGVLPDKLGQLKMQCLPADPVNAGDLLEELVSAQFILRRVAPNGDKVLVIRTFTEHQKISHKTKGRWGDPAEWPETPPKSDGPPENTGAFTPGREGIIRNNSEGDSDVGALTEPSPVDEPDNIRLERGQVLRLLTENGAPTHLTQRPVVPEEIA